MSICKKVDWVFLRDRKRLGTQRILECGHFESTKSCYKCQGMEKHIQTLLSCFFLLKWHVACQCIVNAQVKVYNYPLFRRCDCPAKLRATHHIRQVTMECARMHTVTSHKNDKSKYSHTIDGMQFIQRCLHILRQSRPKFGAISRISRHPSMSVSASRVKSVGYAVLQERDTLALNKLYGISMTLCSDCSQSNFFVKVHSCATWSCDTTMVVDGDELFHLDLFAPVCMAYKLDQGNDIPFVALSNPYMLLDLSLQLSCGWALQLQIDTTFKIWDRDLNKLTLCLNSLGAHYHDNIILYLWTSSLAMQSLQLCITTPGTQSEKLHILYYQI